MSTTSRRYFPFKFSSQIRFMFLSASMDLGVIPVRYKRSRYFSKSGRLVEGLDWAISRCHGEYPFDVEANKDPFGIGQVTNDFLDGLRKSADQRWKGQNLVTGSKLGPL